MTGHRLEIVPLPRHRWIVRYEGDTVSPSEHATLADARADAHVETVGPDFPAPTLADVNGSVLEP